MYYKVSNPKDKSEMYDYRTGANFLLVNVTSIYQLIKLQEKYENVELLYPRAVTVRPETMRQYRRGYQSFTMSTVEGEILSFFNIDEFSKLHKVFEDKNVLIYPFKRGRQTRHQILVSINSSGVRTELF